MTLEPDWSQSVIWALISGVWSMRAWIWVGPKIEVSDGQLVVRAPARELSASLRAATHAIMFGRRAGTMGWMSRYSVSSSPGSRIWT